MLLLFTFDEPSSGSRTTEKRPRPRSFTSPISSEATWETSFEPRHASRKRSFIQTSSSSCSSPYTFRVAAESLRIGSSRRIRLTRPANRDNKRPRSRSTFPACSASVTFVPRRPSVLDVPSLEVVLQLVSSAVEVPPRPRVSVGEVREGLEIPHSLRPDVLHLRREGPDYRVGLVVGERLLALVDRIRHRLADEREVETTALVRHRLDDFHLVVHDLPRGVRIEEEEELRRARPETFHLLDVPAVEERREPPVPFLLVPGLLQGDEKARAAEEGKPIDRRRHPVLRVEEVAARVGGEGLRDAELDRLHLDVRRGLRILRMEHLLEAPPLVHRDHREPPRVVRNLLEATELADRNSHSYHPDDSQRCGAVLTFAASHRDAEGQAYFRREPIRDAMRIPVIILNFKTYPEILGKRGWELAKRFAAVEDDTGASIVLSPPMSDLAHIAKLVHIPVFGQHVDAVEPGPTTGWIPPEALLEAGAAGALINHSEPKVALEEMAKSIPRCQKLGLEVIACADDLAEAETLSKLSPEYIPIEPPQLIGGGGSVETAKPEGITKAVDRIRAANPNVNVLCGAGVKARKDIAKALELGTVGVLLSSGVVKAKDPEKALRDLVKGLR